ncbi:hypothetical protein AiwAL_07500 [Acidiphilium sp. AL]|uniref:Transmembrane protein n=1 Tax=Acidiphilium iwatense TaxID=768198 RepID=A0ABS9DV55_9PROT|nr:MULTISPECIES: hypothetical protein [Acidiphilium]MCF3946626.1 hypothetical protein [Acidiphilium iwatense]MCU4159951.1 hypothetical protein [Acidiphilium sp. AL]
MALPIGARTNIDEELTRLKRGVARKLVYAGLADVLLLWGAIFLFNDAVISFLSPFDFLTWASGLCGLFGTWAITQVRARAPAHAENARRLFWSFVVFCAELMIWQALGIPTPIAGLSLAQQNAGVVFQLTFNMMGLVILGIWVGWEMIALGCGVSAIITADYLLGPADLFIGTSILLTALALLAAGFWMRVSARDISADPFAISR